MTDSLSKARRSWNMSRITSKNTEPELAVRSIVHKLGYRYGLHSRHLPGTPDLVLTRLQTVIFVHGCFWHRHQGCKFTTSPKSGTIDWKRKFSDNTGRDLRNTAELKKLGWHIIVVWGCEPRNVARLTGRLRRILGRRALRVAAL